MNRRLAIIWATIILLAGLSKSLPVLPSASQRSEVARPAVSEGRPVETPLVEALLPKEPDHVVEPDELVDGQRSPGGNFAYEAARNAWIPIDFSHAWHSHNRQRPTAEHLIATHGHARSSVEKWTQREIEICHANDHAAEYAAKQAALEDCRLTGTCGNPTMGRGLLGRRR